MVKFRFQIVIFYISWVAMIFVACSNDNKETLSNNTNSENTEIKSVSENRNLFIIESDSTGRDWQEVEESNSRQRTGIINPSFISIDSSGVGKDFNFNIYDEESLVGEISRVATDLNDDKSISGLLLEDKGSFVFTVNDSLLLGQLRLTDRDKIIQIKPSNKLNEYILTESNRSDLDVLPGSAPLRSGNN